LSTERTYLGWLRSFRGFVGDKEPENLSASDIRNFLSFLAVKRRVSAAAQSKALNVLVFFYRNVLDKDPTDELGAVRAMPGRRLPVVLTPGRWMPFFII
jgi:site-specific recombinase XerD